MDGQATTRSQSSYKRKRLDLQRLAEAVHAIESNRTRSSTSNSSSNGHECETSQVVSTGWGQIDQSLWRSAAGGGLRRGLVHEWLGVVDVLKQQRGRRRWTPPLSILIHLAWRALDEMDAARMGGMVMWIGRRIWPHARALVRLRDFTAESKFCCGGNAESEHVIEKCSEAARHRESDVIENCLEAARHRESVVVSDFQFPISNLKSQISNHHSIQNALSACSAVNSKSLSAVNPDCRLLNHSIFIDPPDDASRLWAIDLSLRCKGLAAVIADGSGLGMAESRRLQLAAEAGSSALGLVARPPWELDQLSAASTRWRVSHAPSDSTSPRWTAQLLRCKGMQLLERHKGTEAQRHEVGPEHHRPSLHASMPSCLLAFALELDREKGVVSLPADVVDRSDQAAASSNIKRRTA